MFKTERKEKVNLIKKAPCDFFKIWSYKKYWYKFGYKIAGRICVNYVKWIIQNVDGANCSDVIFIARDGYLLEKIFNKLTNNKYKTHYLYAPRSLNLLCQLNYEKDGDFTYEHTKTIIDYYRTKSEKIRALPTIKSKEDGVKYINENFDELKKLADIEYKNFAKYIKSNLKDAENIAIVDSVSKFFSAQKIIENCIDKKLLGLYYLIQEGAAIDEINVKSFSPISKYMPEDLLIEFIMTSDEPPILSISGGQVMYKNISKEENSRIKAFKEIAKGTLDFVDDLLKTNSNSDSVESSEQIANFINSFIENPNNTDKKMFKKVLFAYDTQHSIYRPLFPQWYSSNINTIKNFIFNFDMKKLIILLRIMFE